MPVFEINVSRCHPVSVVVRCPGPCDPLPTSRLRVDMPPLLHRIAFLALLGVVAGCTHGAMDSTSVQTTNSGHSPEPKSITPDHKSGLSSAPENVAEALKQFQSQALNSLPKHLMPELREFASNAIKDREHLHARRLTCQACFQRIDGTLTQEERQSLILFGTIDDLKTNAGDCWEIMSFGNFKNSIEGYIDADTGRLLVLWIVPEG